MFLSIREHSRDTASDDIVYHHTRLRTPLLLGRSKIAFLDASGRTVRKLAIASQEVYRDFLAVEKGRMPLESIIYFRREKNFTVERYVP